MFADLPVSSVLGVLAFFFALQRNINETYRGLHETKGSGRPIAPEYKQFAKSWNWYKIIADLADNQILRFDSITALPVTEVYTFLQYRRDKDQAEDAQRKLDRFIAKNRKNADS